METPPKIEPAEKEPFSVDTSRMDYARAYTDYVEKFGKNKEEPSEEQKMALYNLEDKKLEYDISKEVLAKDMLANGVKEAEIFQRLVIGEQELLRNAQVESWPPVKKNCWRQGIDWWIKQKPAYRIAVSSLAITLGVVAFAPGGFAAVGISGAALLAGQRFAKGLVSAGMGQLAGKGVDKFMSRGINRDKEWAIDDLKSDFSLDKLQETETKYQEIMEKSAKAERKKLYIKAAAMIAVGAGTVIGLGMLESAWGGGAKAPVLGDKPKIGAAPEAPPSAKPAGITPPETPKASAAAPGVPEKPPIITHEIKSLNLQIGNRGPEGAIIDHFKSNPESAKAFGWDGKTNLSEWSGTRAHQLWLDDAKNALAKPETIEQLKKLGYTQDADGYAQMMRRISKGVVEVNPQGGKINLANVEYLKARPISEAIGHSEIPATEVPPVEVPATEVPATEVPKTGAPAQAAVEIPQETPIKGLPIEKNLDYWDKELGIGATAVDASRGAIIDAARENFGMTKDLFERFSGMNLKNFFTLDVAEKMPSKTSLLWEGYDYAKISDLQGKIKQIYGEMSFFEQASADKIPVELFIEEHFDELFPKK